MAAGAARVIKAMDGGGMRTATRATSIRHAVVGAPIRTKCKFGSTDERRSVWMALVGLASRRHFQIW